MQGQRGGSLSDTLQVWGDELLSVRIEDPEQARKGRLLNTMVMGVAFCILLLTVVNVVQSIVEKELKLDFILMDVVVLVALVGIWWLCRRGHIMPASIIFVLALIAGCAGLIQPERLAPAGVVFAIPIVAAGALINPNATFSVGLLSAAAYVLRLGILSRLTTEDEAIYAPLFALAALFIVAVQTALIASSDAAARISERRKSEELAKINQELDVRVQRRTQDLAEALSREHDEFSRREAILSSIADGVAVFNPDGTAELANPMIANLLGVRVDDVEGMPADQLLNRLKPDDLQTILTIIHGQGPDRATLKLEWDPGASAVGVPRTLSVSVANVKTRTSANAGTVAVFRDFTREAELDRMKSDFVSMVAHELRTPMTAIQGYVDLVLSGTTGAINEEQERFLRVVQANVQRLATLVSDVLDVSRIEAGKIELNPTMVHVRRLFTLVTGTFAREAADRDIELVGEVPQSLPLLFVDENQAVRILTNLVSNAIKYTPGPGRVTMRARDAGKFVQIDVQDTGMGIPKTYQVRLFSRFYRVRTAATDKISGTGLGLSIVKSLVEMHGGTIWLESEEDRGSTFSFTLPTVPAAIAAGTA